MDTEKIWAAFGGSALCIILFFLGSSIRACSARPQVCHPTVIQLSEDTWGEKNCANGAIALKPELMKIDSQDNVIVRCICPNVQKPDPEPGK